MNPETGDYLTLVDGLRNWAEGMAADRAAVELLIQHDSWLRRGDFLNLCVYTIPAEELLDVNRPVSLISWDATVAALDSYDLPASGSAVGILRLAASLGAGHPVNLRDALVGLDPSNSAAVVDAVITATQSGKHVLATRSPAAPRRIVD